MNRFSIIIPTYNRGWILDTTLRCVLAQDFTDWELLVVDDGSTDNTREIVERYQSDTRVKYIYQANARAAAARQTGLEVASGEWVTYIDSDDEPYPYYLSKALEFFQTHPTVYFAMANMDRTLALHDQNHAVLQSVEQPATHIDPNAVTLQDYYHWKAYPCSTGIFHRRDSITSDIRWDSNFIRGEDIDFLLQLPSQI